jgi:hypothetical protein
MIEERCSALGTSMVEAARIIDAERGPQTINAAIDPKGKGPMEGPVLTTNLHYVSDNMNDS